MAGRRRGNGEGTIYKRQVRDKATGAVIDERWLAQVTLPDGKRKSFYGKTRQEVAAKLTAALRDKARRLMRPPRFLPHRPG